MDSYAIEKTGVRKFTVTVTSPKKLRWKPLDSTGISITSNSVTSDGSGKNYTWDIEVERPGFYELRMLKQGKDGVFHRIVIPIAASR
ncbi:MAG TPA: hypothetical protein O0X70_01560 [Methanocorpusculum sp.]|nr:hypothetical protein [Methanocorpusculum sp.]